MLFWQAKSSSGRSMVEIVAELSGNHGGSLAKMKAMIREAADCGCDYAKFQFYRPEDMPDRHEGDNETMYRRLMVPDEWLPDLFCAAHQAPVGLFASVFSVRAVETLLKFDAPYVKLASMDSTRLSKQTYIDIISAIGDRRDIVYSLDHDGSQPHGLLPLGLPLFCPPPGKAVHTRPGRPHGFSDHTPGIDLPMRYIRRGAKMVEKHFKIDDDCVDAVFSADPYTMYLLCKLAHR